MEDIVHLLIIGIFVLYLGYVVNKWKIQDLEDRIERLERTKEDA